MSEAAGASPDLPAAARRVLAAAGEAGLSIDIRVMAQSTRTAQEAADACACDIGQIVKSLIFRGATSGDPILLLVSGANRVDEAKVSMTIGEGLARPDAAFVRTVTSYAIGGIPPFGHASKLSAWFDENLMRWPTLWAAAGTPTTLFSIAPGDLLRATGATVISVV